MIFAHPKILWLLLVFPPALVLFFWWSLRARRELLTRFVHARLLPDLVAGLSPARRKFRMALLVLAVICLVLALARPQWGFTWEEVKLRGRDIVVAIDTSRSMLAEDIAPNRLARAKLAALDLMQQAKSDRLGLVAFAGTAFLQCPLTIDDDAFRQSVEALDTSIIPQGGTALAEAIDTALTAFKEGDNYKVLVLFSDGEDNDGRALEAATKAAQAGLRIFTVGIGTATGELLRIKDEKGGADFVRDDQGNVVKSHLNESLLREIAGATEGGFYLPLRSNTIDKLYEALAPAPTRESQERLIKHYYERYHWPLGLGILLLLLELFVPERKREPRPGGVAIRPGATAAAQAVLALLAMAASTSLVASPSGALRDYKAGRFDEALKEYERLIQKNDNDPRLHFNAGAAAYRKRDFEEAARQFNAAVAAPDLNLQEMAYYNRGNTFYWQGEQQQELAKKTEAWQKAINDFQSTLNLNPTNANAKINQDYVKKKLEALKEQQQQQQNQQNKDQQDQQKQDQQQGQQQNQQQNQQEQNKQSQQDKNQQQDKQQAQKQGQDQKQQQAQQQDGKDKQQQKEQSQPSKPDQQKADASKGKSQDAADKGQEHGTPDYSAVQMTPQQAQQILDAQKGEEQVLQLRPEGKPAEQARPLKNW